MDHWRRGHKQMCKKIHRGGNTEQYHADKKYKEAVAVAAEACADDTNGQRDSTTLLAAMNLACSLRATGRFDECLSFLRDTMPTAKRVLGADNEVYLNFVWTFSDCINRDRNLSRDDLLDAVATIDDSFRRSRRVMGPQHPLTSELERHLERAKSRAAQQ